MTFDRTFGGGSISYEPPPRTQTRTGLIAAGILIVTGVALVAVAVIGQQLQNPIRNDGDVAIGVVSSMSNGHATIEYGVGDDRYVVTPDAAVTDLSGISAGSSVTVRFDPDAPESTFVDRIDTLEPLTPLLIAGGALLGLGLLFVRFPPRSPERPVRS